MNVALRAIAGPASTAASGAGTASPTADRKISPSSSAPAILSPRNANGAPAGAALSSPRLQVVTAGQAVPPADTRTMLTRAMSERGNLSMADIETRYRSHTFAGDTKVIRMSGPCHFCCESAGASETCWIVAGCSLVE